MAKFPVDAPKNKIVKTLGLLGFRLVREREHIALVRDNTGRDTDPTYDAQSPLPQKFDFTHYLHTSRDSTRRVLESVRAKLK